MKCTILSGKVTYKGNGIDLSFEWRKPVGTKVRSSAGAFISKSSGARELAGGK